MRPEYERVGLSVEAVSPYDSAYFEREAEEYALADFHCVASRIVAEQLSALGIAEHRIWRVPYGADGALFSPEGAKDGTMGNSTGGHILFAGQFGLRKGTKTLLAALRLAEQRPWSLHCFGARLSEADADIGAYRGAVPIRFHGAVSQQRLAAAFRSATVLVLPSLEEGFGLVVPQALACGLPCVVSDRVGAADLIRHRENGSIVPHDSPEALYEEIAWWIDHPRRVPEPQPWEHCASALIQQSALALKATEIKEVSLS
jgi:glycosyltransferase involved in cell wall biosynthesis